MRHLDGTRGTRADRLTSAIQAPLLYFRAALEDNEGAEYDTWICEQRLELREGRGQ